MAFFVIVHITFLFFHTVTALAFINSGPSSYGTFLGLEFCGCSSDPLHFSVEGRVAASRPRKMWEEDHSLCTIQSSLSLALQYHDFHLDLAQLSHSFPFSDTRISVLCFTFSVMNNSVRPLPLSVPFINTVTAFTLALHNSLFFSRQFKLLY